MSDARDRKRQGTVARRGVVSRRTLPKLQDMRPNHVSTTIDEPMWEVRLKPSAAGRAARHSGLICVARTMQGARPARTPTA